MTVKCLVHALENKFPGKLVEDSADKVDILNQFFSSVFTDEDLITLQLIGDRVDGSTMNIFTVFRNEKW